MVGKLDKEIIKKFKEFQKNTRMYNELRIEDVEFEESDIFNDLENITLIGAKKIGSHDVLEKINDKKGVPVYDASPNILTYVDKNKFPNEVFTVKNNNNPDISFASEGNSSAGTNFIIHQDSYFINNHRTVIKFSNKYYSKYIYYKIFDMKKEYGFKRGYIPSQTELKRLSIKVPIPKDLDKLYSSYQIQEALVAFFEYSFSQLNNTRAKIKKRYDIFLKLEKALIPSTFTKDYIKLAFGRYTKKHNIDFNIVDVKFDIKRIHSKKKNNPDVICKKRMGSTPKTDLEGNIEWFSIKDLGDNKGLYINEPNTKKKTTLKKIIEKNGGTSSKNTLITKGDILVSFKLTVGVVKIYNSSKPAYCSEAIDILTPNTDIDTRYLAYNCLLEYPRYGTKTNNGITLNDDDKKQIKIFIPQKMNNYTSLEIQKIIADFIEYTENRLQQEFTKMDEAYHRLHLLRQTYLARTFSLIVWERNMKK